MRQMSILTPMLDVVFILLIFFIVTATFTQEEALGLEPPPPPPPIDQPPPPDNPAILIYIDEAGLISVNGRLADIGSVRANIEARAGRNTRQPSHHSGASARPQWYHHPDPGCCVQCWLQGWRQRRSQRRRIGEQIWLVENAGGTQGGSSDDDINLTPMLDVVFILLIFFIVTAVFIKEPGVDIVRADVDNKEIAKPLAILIAIDANSDIYIDKKQIPPAEVGFVVKQMREDNPKGEIVVQPDIDSEAGVLVDVMETLNKIDGSTPHQYFCIARVKETKYVQ